MRLGCTDAGRPESPVIVGLIGPTQLPVVAIRKGRAPRPQSPTTRSAGKDAMASRTATAPPCKHPHPWQSLVLQSGRGIVTGLALFLWSHQYLASFGVSLAVTAALSVALGLACGVGLLLQPLVGRSTWGRWVEPAAWLTVAVWTVVFAWLLVLGRSLVAVVPLAWLTSEATAFCVMLSIAGLLFVLPVAGCILIAGSTDSSSAAREPSLTGMPPVSVLGVAFGLLCGPALLAPLGGLAPLMVAVTVACTVGLWRSAIAAVDGGGAARRLASQAKTARPSSWGVGLSLLIGLQVPLLSRFALELMPGSPFEHYAVWGGLVAGMGAGLLWAQLLLHRSPSSAAADGPLAAAVIATIWPVVLMSAWGLLVDALLSVNSSVSTVGLVMLIRIMIAGLATAPLGVALGRLWSPVRAGSASEWDAPQAIAAWIGCVCVGIVLSSAAAVSPAVPAAALVAVAMMAAVGRYWILGWPVSARRRQRIAGVATLLSVAVLPLVSGNYRPDLAARLLFSTHTFTALQMGINRDLLPYLDDGRLEAFATGRSSTWTLWRHRGSQLALRQNGLPRGVVSTDPTTTPQFAGEVMPAVVPLVLHDQPQSVLMLGIGSTATLSSVLACPVTSVTCIEGNAELISLIDRVVAPAVGRNPLEDSRVRLLNVDPTLAMLSGEETCDVLIINESQPSVMGSASGFTSEFYAATRAALRTGGLLCQRLQYADFGREPIEDLLATVRTAFPQVALLDAAPGEMLIIATTKSGPLVTEETIDRCDSAHIRNLMAQVGWDWSVLMNIGAIHPEAVDELTSTRGRPNSIRNGRFAYTLPQEVMRWSSPQLPKWQQRQQLLNAHADRMLAWIDDSERTKQVEQRLADVIEQQRLIFEHPDHFWAYRKTLKERLSERPRAVIQQVKHEGLKRTLHPEDRRRKDYLEVLGEAATVSDPSPEEIRRLAEFAVPYDPLVSYFLHQEAARLYEKSSADEPAARFAHLRYSIYFSPPNDQSVHNVVSALRILNDHPELYPDPQQRWDEMNSLLEVLKQRSSLRLRSDQSASAFELVDAERSIEVARRTMAAMDVLGKEEGLAANGWEHRRTVLERMLVQPMWKYHSQQATRLQRQQARASALSETR
jgi:hypothetical protein